MTRLIWAPTGDFLIVLTCWSLSVSYENLIAAWGFAGAEYFVGFDGPLFGLCCFVFFSTVWHFACCCLNLFKLSLRLDIDLYNLIGRDFFFLDQECMSLCLVRILQKRITKNNRINVTGWWKTEDRQTQ